MKTERKHRSVRQTSRKGQGEASWSCGGDRRAPGRHPPLKEKQHHRVSRVDGAAKFYRVCSWGSCPSDGLGGNDIAQIRSAREIGRVIRDNGRFLKQLMFHIRNYPISELTYARAREEINFRKKEMRNILELCNPSVREIRMITTLYKEEKEALIEMGEILDRWGTPPIKQPCSCGADREYKRGIERDNVYHQWGAVSACNAGDGDHGRARLGSGCQAGYLADNEDESKNFTSWLECNYDRRDPVRCKRQGQDKSLERSRNTYSRSFETRARSPKGAERLLSSRYLALDGVRDRNDCLRDVYDESYFGTGKFGFVKKSEEAESEEAESEEAESEEAESEEAESEEAEPEL